MANRTEAILKRIPVDARIVAAEIGVYRAENAVALLKQRPLLTLLCVDAWKPYPEMHCYQDPMAREGNWDAIAIDARDKLRPFAERVVVMQMSSTEAAKLIADAALDLVFIDGCHKNPWVRQDIAAWLPKVKKGSGCFSGHDYREQFPDVCRAVDTLAADHTIEFDADSTWFIRL